MTIGIGVLSEGGAYVVLGTDMRASFPRLTANDMCGKMWDLPSPFSCGAAVAGVLAVAQPFVDQLAFELGKVSKEQAIYDEHLENAIDEARYRIFARRIDWSLKRSYGVSLRQWQRGKVPGGKLDDLLIKALRNHMENEPFPLEAIVAGFVRGKLQFYKASEKNHLEKSATPGVYVIGRGGALAMNHLNRRGHHTGCSLARALLHVVEALEEAEKEPLGTVGKTAQLLAIGHDGSMARIMPTHHTLVTWKKTYKDRDSTWSLQNNKVADVQAKYMCRVHRDRE